MDKIINIPVENQIDKYEDSTYPLADVIFEPSFEKKDYTNTSLMHFPSDTIMNYAPMIAELAQSMGTVGGEGIYRVTFPAGVSGSLAKFKDGSGFLGTIMENGIEGQARLNNISMDPTALFMAAAMANINMKLDAIQEKQQEMLDLLVMEKEAQQEGDLKMLSSLVRDLKYNWNNQMFKTNRHNQVQEIKRKSEQDMILYRKKIEDAMSKKNIIHGDNVVNTKARSIFHDFQYYQLALFECAFSSFMEIILLDNYDKGYLSSIAAKLEKDSYEYKELYTRCYDTLELFAKSSIEVQLLKGSKVLDNAIGKTIGKIPLKGAKTISDRIVSSADTIGEIETGLTDNKMKQLRCFKDNGVKLFVDNIHDIKMLYNEPIQIVMTEDAMCVERLALA